MTEKHFFFFLAHTSCSLACYQQYSLRGCITLLCLQVKLTYHGQLRERESQYAEMHSEMLKELHRLREELRKCGKKVPEIDYDFGLMGACPTLKTPPISPTSAKTPPTSAVALPSLPQAPPPKGTSANHVTEKCEALPTDLVKKEEPGLPEAENGES